MSGPDRFTRAREGGPGSLDGQSCGLGGEPLVAGQLVDGWQIAELHLSQV